MEKHCTECCDNIDIAVKDLGHDIIISDTENEDNQICITKDEAEYLIKRLKQVLK